MATTGEAVMCARGQAPRSVAAASSSLPGRHIGWRKVTPAEFVARYQVIYVEFQRVHHAPNEYDWCDAYGVCRNTLRGLRTETGICKGSTGLPII